MLHIIQLLIALCPWPICAKQHGARHEAQALRQPSAFRGGSEKSSDLGKPRAALAGPNICSDQGHNDLQNLHAVVSFSHGGLGVTGGCFFNP